MAINIAYRIGGNRALTLVKQVWAEAAVQCGDPPVGAPSLTIRLASNHPTFIVWRGISYTR